MTALLIQLSWLLPMVVFGTLAVRQQWPHRKILLLYLAMVALMATIGGLPAPKHFWLGARFVGEIYAISLGVVWIGVWLWRMPGRLQQAFRGAAIVVWLLSVPALVWALELVGGD